MGKTLSLRVVAEGVETLEQENFLRDNACDETQGFYFSRPVTADKFAKLLHDHIASPHLKSN
jgi:EAL domain-containing protein (putative c-di-GMP-specific phosphodiesterase class I)